MWTRFGILINLDMKNKINYLLDFSNDNYAIMFEDNIVVENINLSEKNIIELVNALNNFIKFRTKESDNIILI